MTHELFGSVFLYDYFISVRIYHHFNYFAMFAQILHYVFLGSKYPKSREMLEKTNRLAEKISKVIQFGMVYVTVPGFILFKASFCFFKYFNSDLNNDAFELPFPMW